MADAASPLKGSFKTMARSIRLIKILADEPCWPLWRMADLKIELLSRVDHLAKVPKYEHVRPCGEAKQSPLSFCKADASQFFKSASVVRALSRLDDLLKRLEAKRYVGVQLAREGRVHGKLSRTFVKPIATCKFISFQSIRQCMNFALNDQLSFIGDIVMFRHTGWPMGGSFSEPGTLIDLSESTRLLFGESCKQMLVGS